MQRIALWRWRVHSKTTGHLYVTHKCMTEAQARAIDPLAERLDWVIEYRWVPDTSEGVDGQAAPRRRR